ncbi:MAG TPA: Mov34/MPN/PAD-1 family protein [Candidatus Norongarragalinales archaeon]|jgi:proteasome lid subunit RPN8/RPN11|nr:Mov34/MPN/PAD-1 family protein [Candidatus Norongarragalinales archaeon]
MHAAFVLEKAMRAAEKHALEHSSRQLESMGLLIGQVFENNGEKYVIAEEYVTAPNNATAASVRFSQDAFSELAQKISSGGKGKIVVGWLHSHPGYGCWLSGTDVNTQRKYFSEDFHIALVVDPHKEQGGRMLKKAFKIGSNGYYEVPLAVIRKK